MSETTQALVKPGRKWHLCFEGTLGRRRSLCMRQREGQDGWTVTTSPQDPDALCRDCRRRREEGETLALPAETLAQINAINTRTEQAQITIHLAAAECGATFMPGSPFGVALTKHIAAAIEAAEQRGAERARRETLLEVAEARRDDLEFAVGQICLHCSNNRRLYPPDTEYSNYTHEVLEITGNDYVTSTIHARAFRVICAANILHTMIKDMQPGGWREYKGAANDR